MAETWTEKNRYWGDEEEGILESGDKAIPFDLNIDQLSLDDTVNKVPDETEEDLNIHQVNKVPDEPEDLNIRAVTSADTPYVSASTFEELNICPELLKGLYVEMRFQRPSKIQALTLPMILSPPYKDLVAQAHNGSGKTTCFTLGMLSRVDPNVHRTQALCICPTRELAIQNLGVLRKMGKYTGITSEAAIPTSDDDKSKFLTLLSAQIVIGTPGTVKRLMSRKKLCVRDVNVLVFDEADHMLATDGFQDDSLKITKDIMRGNAQCQVLLFSATFDEIVKKFKDRIVKKEPNELFVNKENLSLSSLKQYKVTCSDERAKCLLVKDRILEFAEKMGQAIIFVNSRRSAVSLHHSLTKMGYEVTTIHGAHNTVDRDQIVKEFKNGVTQILISTDLLARGFDQEQVNVIVNYDLPVKFDCPSEPNYEVYLHRIGRAGRFGRKGAIFNFVMDSRDQMIMDKIDRHFQTKIIEVPRSNSEEDFMVAMKTAGLM